MKEILIPAIILASLGLIFGIMLGIFAKIFMVKKDERIEKIEELLPGANCGGCGYAGCGGYAKAIVENGAEIIFVSSAGDAAEQCIARARDTGVYLAVCGMNTENIHGWGPARVVSPLGELLAHGGEHAEPVVCEIDLNKKVRRFWLSVGPADSQTRGVYRYEKNPKSFL